MFTSTNVKYYHMITSETELSHILSSDNCELYSKIMDCEFFSNYDNNDGILVDSHPSKNAWIIRDIEDIVNELNTVLIECKSKNVKYRWL